MHMNMQQPWTIQAVLDAYKTKDKTPEGVLEKVSSYIHEHDTDTHAYMHQFEGAKEQAEHAGRVYKTKKDVEPLCGVPVAVKNNILVKGENVTAASKILEEYVAPYDATIIERLKAAGAVLVGATNLDEFAMGSSTENSAFGVTKNPIDTTRVPGGSSGGSAAAVAMGSVPAAIGTDTGGSIRQPASCCGLVGLKPTYGAVSRYGLIAMGSSLDQAGTLTNTVTDAETVFNVINGHDPKDATSYKEGTYPRVESKVTYRIGVPRDFLKEGIDEKVHDVFLKNIDALVQAGHEVVDVELPYMKRGLAAYYIVMPAEVSSNLARYDGMRFGLHTEGDDLMGDYLKTRAEGFGPEVKRRILLGTYVLSAGYYDAYYGKAEHVRNLMRKELSETFKDIDLIITPTAPTPAFKIGEKSDPLSMYLQDIFTVPANLTGVPALSVPGGTVTEGGSELPVGMQFMAPHAGEERLFDIGKRFLSE